MDVFSFIPGYERYVYGPGKEPLFVVLLSFLIAFAITRGYTRLARRRGWGSGNVGGVHLHHCVPGIILVLVAGVVSFSRYAHNEQVEFSLAILFGVGAALVLDEFALIFHLKDVYWSAAGRSSVDATIMGVLLAGLLLVSSSPFEASNAADAGDPRFITFTVLAFDGVFAVFTFLKGKYFMGILAIFVAPIGWIGAVRLAKPYSPWAHLLYEPDKARSERGRRRRAHKLERSWRRFERSRLGRFENWLVDIVGGRPHVRSAALPEEAASTSRQTVGVAD